MIFPSGFKIMTYRAAARIEGWNSWGSVYESNRIFEGITYPVRFENTPNYAITIAMNTIGFECTSISTATFNGFNAVRPNDAVAPGSYSCQVTFWGF